jgi:tetratricopeptide (TPR) repeat protein
LLKSGQHAKALEQVDRYLAGKPEDAQGRFLKGIILTGLNRQNDAVAVFRKLTEDYPELPEPYNNLAVIYAQQKQYEKSKQALEMAIRTHPAYATAHENLGDIYTRMASQAYDKALQLDSSNTSAQTKLSMIRELMGNAGRPGKPTVVAAATPRPTEPTKPAEIAKPAETTKPLEMPKPVEVAKPAEPPKPVVEAPKPAETTKPLELARPAEPRPAAAMPADTAGDAARAVEAWAAAWSRKDVKAYLAHYGRDFKTPGGEARAAWEAERTKRIAKPGPIQVAIEGLRISTDGPDRATARFRQYYRSAGLKAASNKVLTLARQDGRWLIVQEAVGN